MTDQEATAPSTSNRTKDASSLWTVLARDIALLAAVLSLFAAADAWHTLNPSGLSSALSLVDGLLAGLAIGAVAHEWGHFAGARLSGGDAPLKPASGFLPLFDFDYAGNSQQHFRSMSIGGNVAHWLVVVIFVAQLPMTTVGQAALASGAFGFAVFASSVEFPVISHSYRGLPGMEALSKIPSDFLPRYGTYGALAALAVFILL
jgi:hypothetical protein